MDNTTITKIDEILNASKSNDYGAHKITDIFEEEIDPFVDDISDYEFGENEDIKNTALSHIYKDLAYMQLVSTMTMRLYGLNPEVLKVFIGKALDMELGKVKE